MNSLDLSIEKWEEILKGGVDRGGENCTLCQRFIYRDGCLQCPVYKRTGKTGCVDTPWMQWYNHHVEKHNYERGSKIGLVIKCEECGRLAMEEIKFLKSLREV